MIISTRRPHHHTTQAPPAGQFTRPSRLKAITALVVWCALTVSAAASTDLAETLQVLTERSINLANATIGVHVRELETGATLFANRDTEPLLPASNLKLVTTGAALATFGPDHAFSTRFQIAGSSLVVVGSGDPGLADPALLEASDPPMTVEDLLASIVNAVRATGVSELDEIIIDDRVFDRELAHPTWPEDQLNRWYCAEVAGLNFYTNCITFDVRPGSGPAGTAPDVTLLPDADWIEWSNRAETVTKGRTTAWVARPRPANRFSLFGDVHRRAPALIDVALHEPQLFAGRLLADRLTHAGVTIGDANSPAAAIRNVRLIAKDETPHDPRTVAIVRTAMADALRRANVNSQNMYTEALLKATGNAVTKEPGSWTNGAAVIRMILAERLGPDHARSVRIADGSGLSRDNRIAPATLTAWLASLMQDDTLAKPFLDSLPTPGEGTLRNRFRDDELQSIVRAKSGSIRGVRCLSGVVISPRTGRTVAFSVLLNDLDSTAAVRAAKTYHEEVVSAIDEWLVDTDTMFAVEDTDTTFGG